MTVTFADVLEMAGYVPECLPGLRLLTVLEITASGSRLRAHVRCEQGNEIWLPLGRIDDRRALSRRLRVLVGSAAEDLRDLAAIRAELVGKHFRVRLERAEFNGHQYMELRRV